MDPKTETKRMIFDSIYQSRQEVSGISLRDVAIEIKDALAFEETKALIVALEEAIKCPYDICDGSGEYQEGQFDDIRTVKCLCKKDDEATDMDDDS